jgi:TRAP-type C4-dicarboxylate transport system substrate-binding protein
MPRGSAYDILYHKFTEDVKIMSNGRIEITESFDGEGIPAGEILHAVRTGLVEMGAPFPGYHLGELPFAFIEVGLPGGPKAMQELRALFHHAGFKEALRKAYAKHNVYWLSEYYQPGCYVLTKKPIKSLEDFKGMKIRVPGAYGKHFRNLGATPVSMTFSEVYTSLATGVVDGVDGCNIVDHRDAKFYEQAKYMYPLPVSGAQACPIIVNIKVWNDLPADLKLILERAAQWHGDLQGLKNAVWEKEALNEMLSKGLQMSPEPSPEDVVAWTAAGQKVWDEFEKQDDDSRALIKILRDFMKKMGY